MRWSTRDCSNAPLPTQLVLWKLFHVASRALTLCSAFLCLWTHLFTSTPANSRPFTPDNMSVRAFFAVSVHALVCLFPSAQCGNLCRLVLLPAPGAGRLSLPSNFAHPANHALTHACAVVLPHCCSVPLAAAPLVGRYSDTAERRVECRRKPFGVVVCITPWNYPLFCACGCLARGQLSVIACRCVCFSLSGR